MKDMQVCLIHYTKYTAVMCVCVCVCACNSLTLNWLHRDLMHEAKKVYNVSQTGGSSLVRIKGKLIIKRLRVEAEKLEEMQNECETYRTRLPWSYLFRSVFCGIFKKRTHTTKLEL